MMDVELPEAIISRSIYMHENSSDIWRFTYHLCFDVRKLANNNELSNPSTLTQWLLDSSDGLLNEGGNKWITCE